MKVVFEGNDTADVSEIQSVSVITAAKRIEVHVKRQAEETEEDICDLPFRTGSFRKKWAEEIANELEEFSKAPDTPIDQVIASTAWARGCLQVELDVDSDTSARGLARLCWYWPGRRTRMDEELGRRTGFGADEIKEVASRDSYKQYVEDLMFKARDADEFKKWVRSWGQNMPARLGKLMRLRENTTAKLIKSVAGKHGIDLNSLTDSGTLPRKNTIPNSDLEAEMIIGSGKSSIYLYYYPQYQESAESKGEKVWACKIGRTIRDTAEGRVRAQATGLPENPMIGLHIQTDNPHEIERIIHNILKVRGKHVDEAPGREWFVPSPSEVKAIYKFIGESSGKNALDG